MSFFSFVFFCFVVVYLCGGMNSMKKYVELALRKEKKPVSLNKIIHRIEKILSDERMQDVFLSDSEKINVFQILEDGVKQYDVYKTPSNNYISMMKTSFRKGRFYGDRTGAGKVSVVTSYLDRDGKIHVQETKYNVSKDDTNGSIDGDFVLIDINVNDNTSKVIQVLDRQLEMIPGEVYRVGNSYFVRPVDKKKQGLMIALEDDAIEGERVAVTLKEQTGSNFYIGEIKKVFNHKDDPNEDILWEAFKHGIDNDFSKESLEQLEHIPNTVRDIDRIGREDLTDWEIFTIDGIDTKDMDDAISCHMNKDGNYVLGVHITDVASIIPKGSPLDIDAFQKGNSYYLGGTVLPMTPHKISNGIGSLNPYVDRMAISCIMEISPDGDVLCYRISPTIIHSKMKMSYDKVNQLLKNHVVDSDYAEFEDTLRLMEKLSLILRRKRLKNGAIEFNRSELKAVYNEEGKAIDFSLREQDVAENLIEEFMLAANETVDRDLSERGLPCVHRVHDTPNEDKIAQLLQFLEAVNLPYREYSAEDLAYDKNAYQKFVKYLSDTGRLSDLLLTESIKCMSRAKYSSENIGHYGLSKDYYCHFTSPVRRYSDLTVHRILWDCVFHSPSSKVLKEWSEKVPEIAEKTSRMERVADEAERDVLRMQCAEYMSNHIGEEYEATIISVSDDCILVQLDNLIEGVIRLRNMTGNYVYSPETYSIISLDNKDCYTVGDRLLVKVKDASKELKRIDFEILDKLYDTPIQNEENIHQVVKIKAKKESRNH